MNALRLAELAKLLLMPGWVALHLINGWSDTSNVQQILQLLGGEVGHADGSSLARIVQLLHCTPSTGYIRWDQIVSTDTSPLLQSEWPLNLQQICLAWLLVARVKFVEKKKI